MWLWPLVHERCHSSLSATICILLHAFRMFLKFNVLYLCFNEPITADTHSFIFHRKKLYHKMAPDTKDNVNYKTRSQKS